MWYVTNQKNDVSALGLSRVLGIHHETAWTWLHKLRRAMVRPDRDQLMGTVEVDETYVGGPEPGRPGRQTVTKAIVAIAVEVGGNDRLGRVRLAQVTNVTGPTLVGFVTDRVAGDAPIHTDAWPGYTGLSAAGYSHRVTNLSVRNAPTTVAMPAARRPPPAASHRCSNGGWWVPTRARSHPDTSTTTSTSSPSASTGVTQLLAACSSTGSCSNPYEPIPTH